MTKATSNQSYFTASNVEEIVDHIMGLLIVSTDKKVAATQALNTIRILRDRLENESVLELIYTDETIVPKPLIKFVRDYLNGEYKQPEAEQILEGLQADMRQHYFQRKIPFDDLSKLPRSTVFDPTGNFTKEIKENLEAIVAEYNPNANSKSTAEEIYTQACNNPTGDVDFDALVGAVAEIIARKDYMSLVLSVGARNPTPQQFASRYVDALQIAYEKLGTSGTFMFKTDIERDAVVEERTRDEVYQRELEAYTKIIGALSL